MWAQKATHVHMQLQSMAPHRAQRRPGAGFLSLLRSDDWGPPLAISQVEPCRLSRLHPQPLPPIVPVLSTPLPPPAAARWTSGTGAAAPGSCGPPAAAAAAATARKQRASGSSAARSGEGFHLGRRRRSVAPPRGCRLGKRRPRSHQLPHHRTTTGCTHD